MAVSRPVLLALLGAVLVGALFFATMGARQSEDGSGPAATPAAEKSPPRTAKAKAKAAGSGVVAASPKSKPAAQKPKPAPRKPRAAASTGVPADVTKALADKRTVVLFFFQRGSADDDATAKAVDSVRGRAGVKVFSAPIKRLADFRGVTGGAGVSQAPAVVIVGGEGSARLIEGYIDSETLAQEVADAR